jgi:energy-coupling factor transporter ATP-binding protein EcfA2
LHAQAASQDTTTHVPTRLASAPGQVLVDLADASKHIVEIDSHGWRVQTDLTRLFRHNRNARPLPIPIEPPTSNVLDQLRSLLNIRSAGAWTRILIWLTAALRPTGPYPTLVLHGPPGSGKSTLLRILRSLIDPGAAPYLPHPTYLRELDMLAAAHWVLAFDHVHKLPPGIAAALAQLRHTRPILFTGAATLSASGLAVGLRPIQPSERRTEQYLFDTVDTLRPALLGALCTAVSAALARTATTLSLWVAAASPALGLTELSIAQEFHALENPVAAVIYRLLDTQAEWSGAATELLSFVRRAQPALTWPATPKGLSQLLGRTPLQGVLMEASRTNARRTLRFSKIGDASCVFRPLNGARFPI